MSGFDPYLIIPDLKTAGERIMKTRLLLNLRIFVLSFFIEMLGYLSAFAYAGDDPKQPMPKLPSGPEGKVPFGAYYTKLAFTPEWDSLWPVSYISDVVVRFDDREPRFVFWRGTSYIPCWAAYTGAWFTNEFFERSGGAVSGTTSMVEPMSDKQCRYSNIRIIENHDARVVIHWRYAPVDLDYQQAFIDPETHWGDWADEYYIIYPDAVGVRKATLHTSALNEWIEYQESIVINQPGTIPEDNLALDAVTLYNIKGERKTYTWTEKGGPGFQNPPDQACIQKINFTTEYKPFTIVNPVDVSMQSYGGHAPGSCFNRWDHWPVSQAKSDTRVATSGMRPSHTSLSQIKWKPSGEDKNSRTWIMLHGMSNTDDSHLISLAKSWIHPARMLLFTRDFDNEGYDASQRAYVITSHPGANQSTLELELQASEETPVVNPAFLIKNWGDVNARLTINGSNIEKGEAFRTGQISTLDGADLVVWIKTESTRSLRILLTPIKTNIH